MQTTLELAALGLTTPLIKTKTEPLIWLRPFLILKETALLKLLH